MSLSKNQNGNVSRKRRFSRGEARMKWYAKHRAERFARRMWAA